MCSKLKIMKKVFLLLFLSFSIISCFSQTISENDIGKCIDSIFKCHITRWVTEIQPNGEKKLIWISYYKFENNKLLTLLADEKELQKILLTTKGNSPSGCPIRTDVDNFNRIKTIYFR